MEPGQHLIPYCTLRDFDYTIDFEFHATLAMDLNHEQFNSVISYIADKIPGVQAFSNRGSNNQTCTA